MENEKIQVDLAKLRSVIDGDPKKKKQIQELLDLPRQSISKILTGKRALFGAELLTIASVYDVNPMELGMRS